MKSFKVLLISNSILYAFGLLWAGSTMDSYTLYSTTTIVISGFLIAQIPLEDAHDKSTYYLHYLLVVIGVLAAVLLLVEDFTRKYGYNESVIIMRFLFISIICYNAYEFWKYRKTNLKPK